MTELLSLGALTLKSFPFIIRSWNVKSYSSVDATDAFGQSIRVYVRKNQVIKIEPQFENGHSSNWLTDKGRQFFDSIFASQSKTSKTITGPLTSKKEQWEKRSLVGEPKQARAIGIVSRISRI